MPIFWWYLLKNYLNVLLLSLFSFVAILLISRLEEIAQFAAMGAKFSYLIIFTLYQIPYILPIAIPISCLISAMILFQRLSSTHEFTALRSCGIALSRIITPILLASLFLSVGCFYITSEM
ncbi:MAG TPA: LptF/LptG family permease, partial [Waddliaceae bacterium]